MTKALPGRNAQICAEYLEGHALETVGGRYGITRERVRQILNANGIEQRHHGIQSPHRRAARNKHAAAVLRREERKAQREAAIANVRKLYDAGLTYSVISEQTSLSIACIENYLWLSGRPSRNRSVGKSRDRLTDEDRDIIARRYFARENVRVIAADFDICYELVSRIANSRGFFRKPPRKDRTQAIAVASTMRDGQ